MKIFSFYHELIYSNFINNFLIIFSELPLLKPLERFENSNFWHFILSTPEIKAQDPSHYKNSWFVCNLDLFSKLHHVTFSILSPYNQSAITTQINLTIRSSISEVFYCLMWVHRSNPQLSSKWLLNILEESWFNISSNCEWISHHFIQPRSDEKSHRQKSDLSLF